jgi:hypothetical protein
MSDLTQAWLEDQTSIRCLLVEITARNVIAGTETTFYLSNMGYITTSADVVYLPYLTGSLQTTESLSIEGSLSMSFGDIQVANLNGDLDTWLDSTKYIWVNRNIKVYLGDPRWVCVNLASVQTKFEKIFDGIVADVDSSARDSINIKVRDKLQRLNYPLTDNILGVYGTWAAGQANQDTIRPLIFGEVNNISPVLVDPSKLEYMFNDTSVGTLVTNTTFGTNIITCNSTAGFAVNKPIVITFSTTAYPSTFGNLVSGTTYYIKTIDSTNTFTIATVSTGGATNTATAFGLTTAALTTTGNATNLVQAEVNITTSELVIEIRDNGVPIYTDAAAYTSGGTRPQGATVTLGTGKFALISPASGTVTASVQGVKRSVNLTAPGSLVEGTYVNNIANIVALIVTQYGQGNQRLSFSDIDLTNFNAFSTSNTAAVGVAVLDRTNTLNICQELANSANAQMFFNRAGLLQLLQLGTITSDATMSITDSDILHHSLRISNRTEVVAATKVGYCLNYTTQTALAASIPGTANIIFADPWYSTTVVDTAVQSTYKLTTAPVQKDTKLIAGADSLALATYLNNYFKVPRTIYSFTGTAKLMGLKLGQGVTLTHNRFGLNAGKSGQVITLAPDWANGTVNVEVII